MKIPTDKLSAPLIFFLLILSTFLIVPKQGSEILVETRYDFKDFDALHLNSSIAVNVVQSETFKIIVSCNENFVKDVRIFKNGATLNLGMSKKKSYQNLKFSAEIHMPILKSLDLKGASKLTTNLSQEADLAVKISGASKISAKVSLFNFMVNASGASVIELNGKVRENAEMEINGASMIKAKKLIIDQNLKLKASGASTTEINVNGKLRADLSGASRLRYGGNPENINVNATGASSARKM